jgi:ABC-type uncharacterized transport system fused permease/ATPase subunit
VTFDGTTARVPAVNGDEAASRTTLLAGPHSVRALSTTGTDSRTEIEVRNIGGISNAELTISPGATLISGENASNKSSLLRSLAACSAARCRR